MSFTHERFLSNLFEIEEEKNLNLFDASGNDVENMIKITWQISLIKVANLIETISLKKTIL